METKQEIVIMFSEQHEPKAILHSNGHQTFYRLKKMTREEISSLLDAEAKTS